MLATKYLGLIRRLRQKDSALAREAADAIEELTKPPAPKPVAPSRFCAYHQTATGKPPLGLMDYWCARCWDIWHATPGT